MPKRREILERLCSSFGIAILYAFGSQAENVRNWVEERIDGLSATSDVDIGVRGISGKKWSAIEKVRLSIALEDLLSSSKVDLVMLSEADPFLAAEIIRGERLFALDEYEADEFELYILRRAGDLALLERERMNLVLGESR